MFSVFLYFTSIPDPFLCIFDCLYLFPLSQKLKSILHNKHPLHFFLCSFVHSVTCCIIVHYIQVLWFLYLGSFMLFLRPTEVLRWRNLMFSPLAILHSKNLLVLISLLVRSLPMLHLQIELSQIALSQVVLQSILLADNHIFLNKKRQTLWQITELSRETLLLQSNRLSSKMPI